MADDAWRTRLEAAVAQDGRALREISLAAKLSHGYLHGILRDDKEPTMDRFIRICKALNVSVAYVLLGINMSSETEALIQAIEDDEGARDALLSLLARRERA